MENLTDFTGVPVEKLSPSAEETTGFFRLPQLGKQAPVHLQITGRQLIEHHNQVDVAVLIRFPPAIAPLQADIKQAVCKGIPQEELCIRDSLKSDRGNPDACRRFFYEYAPVAGQGHFIHTYEQDGDPLPSFEGEPVPVEIAGDIDALSLIHI